MIHCIWGSVHSVTVAASGSTCNIVGLLNITYCNMWPIYLANPAYFITSSVTLCSLSFFHNRTQAEGTPRSLSVMACGIFLIFLTWSCFLQCRDSVKLFFSLYMNLAGVVVQRKELSLMGMNLPCVSSLSHPSLSLFLSLINVNFPGIEHEHTDAFVVH